MKKFFIKLSAIVDCERKQLNSETCSGNIHWLTYTLENFYGIKLTDSQARYHAKRKTQFLTNKEVNLGFSSVHKQGLPISLGPREELLVQIL